MLTIQTFLRNGGTLDALLTRFAITAKRHRAHPNLVLLKYNQIDSPMAEPIVRECRGIILDEADGWRVVSHAFDKFFNHGEGHAASIDWATARVQEKLDGSLLVLYPYRGEWHVATSGTPDASGDVHGVDTSGTWEPRAGARVPCPRTFAEYFWQTLALYEDDGGDRRSLDDVEHMCFYFELTGPLNRIVVVHNEPRLTLLGARDIETGRERTVNDAGFCLGMDVPHVREFPLSSIDGILASFAALSPLSQEGYVVVDGAFNRIKVKHPGYVALHHAKDGLGTKAFVEIARSGETPEVMTAFPELKPQLEDAVARLSSLVDEVEADYERLRAIEEQRAFAIQATKTRCSAALFQVRAKKAASVRGFFAGMPIDGLMRLLGYKADKREEAA